nr:MAG TPA: hypothetical protein [Bacteriophage sp.]DAK79792.1 MAG TPA: hypothetical protein [Caudoviricetes sp.]DAL05163.1 MAG TPA: hypothetical protein [Caudoviricetes sp.]DAM92826.1 MAG TPA: hypothetical protein [Caudoviricetes sp.]DAO26234.1 MAG TPA: hypothetical protein [Caudoviricetes sp.]
MTTDRTCDIIRLQNPNQAKRHSLFPVSAAILLHRKEDIRAVRCSFAHGITAAP